MKRIPLIALLLSAVILLLHPPGLAAADTTRLQLELVEHRIETLRARGETPEDSATLRAYLQTLTWLRETLGQEELAEQLTQLQESPAKQEAEVRARISAQQSSPAGLDPDELAKLSWAQLNDKAINLRKELSDLVRKRDSVDQQIATEANSLESTRTRLAAIDAEESALPASQARFDLGGAPSQFEASQWQLAAQRQALEAERSSLNARLNSQPVRSRLRRAEREELVASIELLQHDLNTVESLLATQRPTVTNQALQEISTQSPGYELIRQLADQNAELTNHRAQLANEITTADAEKTRIDGKLFELMEDYNAAQRLVDSGGRASVYGPFLMSYYLRLDHYRVPASEERDSSNIGEIVIERARHEQQLSETLNNSEFIGAQQESLGIQGPLDEAVMQSATQLVSEQRELLSELMASESRLLLLLGKIDISHEQLDSLADEFKAFLIGHILWVRSHLPISAQFTGQVWLDVRQAAQSIRESLAFHVSIPATASLLAGLFFLLLRRKMWRRMESINRRIGKPRNDSILYSLETLLLTLLRSTAIPLIMAGLALSISENSQGLYSPLALALLTASAGVFTALFLRDSTAPGGICRVHFVWPENRCNAVLSLMTWTLVRLMPVALVASFLVRLEQNTPHAVLGRLFLCAVAIMLALKTLRMVRHKFYLEAAKGIPLWMQNSLVIGLIGFLVYTVLAGFLLPARIIYFSLSLTALALVGLTFLHELLMRWLLITRRRIRFQALLATQPGSEGEEKAESEARNASLGDISDSTARLIRSLVYASGIVAVVLIWAPLLPAIQGLQKFSLWTVTQTVNGEQLQTHITLATIVLATLVIIATFYAARRLPALIELVMRSTGKSTPATRYTVSTITNYVIIAIGTMVFFSTLKMSWSQLQWLVAALGVGIGFGLQEIVANFISGLIILFERPIRVGDVVTIGESSGTVTRIQIRATTIRDWDGKELLVPNKEFVTGRLLNWTLSDNTNRVVVDVGIAYGSDVSKAMKILQQVITEHPAVLKEPPPNILFTQFGDNALHLSARCFFAELEDRLKRLSELHQQIYAAFNEAGIVIAFPQLDVHMDTNSPLTVRFENDTKNPAESVTRSAG